MGGVSGSIRKNSVKSGTVNGKPTILLPIIALDCECFSDFQSRLSDRCRDTPHCNIFTVDSYRQEESSHQVLETSKAAISVSVGSKY